MTIAIDLAPGTAHLLRRILRDNGFYASERECKHMAARLLQALTGHPKGACPETPSVMGPCGFTEFDELVSACAGPSERLQR